MTSVNTNVAAITALRTLQQTNNQLDATQSRISTGLKIGEAKDNAAYWAISTTLKSDNKSLATVKDALGLGSATVDVAYQGLNKAKDVLDDIKAKLTAATQPGVDKNVIQSEIGELQKQLVSIAGSSVFSGENWLSVNSEAVDYDATKKIVASFARDSNNSVEIGTVDVAIGGVALFDSSTVAGKNGILDNMQLLKDKNGLVLSVGGTADTSGNTNAAGLATAVGTAVGTVGPTGSNNTSVTTGAVAGAAAASTVGAATGASVGVASTRTEAANFSSITGTVNGTAATDTLNIGMVIDGVAKTVNVSNASGVGAITLANIVSAINATAGPNSYGPGIASIDTSGGGSKLVLTGGTAGATLNTGITSLGVTGATGSPVFTGLTTSTTTGTPSAATSGKLNSTLSNTGLADGDVITVSYKLGTGATLTKDVTVTTAASFDKTAFATAWGSVAGTTVAAGSGTTVDFTDSSTTGATSKFSIMDVVVKSSSATGSVIKNIDPLSGITGSKATSVRTGNLTWTDLAATDKVTLGLNDGTAAAGPVTVDAGASVSAFATNLNANTTFNTAFKASVVSNQLVITKTATGTSGGSFGLTAVSFTNAAGVAKSVATTGFGQIGGAPTATTGTFSTFTLDGNDTLDLSIQVGTGTAKKVSIDQALVNSTLGASAAGTVATTADFKRVVDAAIAKSGVTGVTTTNNGTTLSFNGTLGQSLTVAGGTASQGAQTMSVATMDISDAGLLAKGVDTGDEISAVLSSYITIVNNAINSVTTAASNLGAVASRIDMQKSFVNTLMDTIDKGIGGLIDADMSEESTKLQALQVKQSLGVQALSIANQSSQSVLRLFQ